MVHLAGLVGHYGQLRSGRAQCERFALIIGLVAGSFGGRRHCVARQIVDRRSGGRVARTRLVRYLGRACHGYLRCTAEGVSFLTQLIGTAVICAWAFFTMLILFGILKAMGLLRVSAEEETRGLDISEHGMHAYPQSQLMEDHVSPVGT